MAGLRYLVFGLVAACRYGFPEVVDAYSCTSCLQPSNGITVGLLDEATADLDAADLVFDTTTGEIKSGTSVVRPAGVGVTNGIGFYQIDPIAVFVAHSITAPVGATWSARGDRSFALFSATTIAIVGTLDVGAIDGAGGPNGTAGGTGAPRISCEGQDGRYKMSLTAGAGGGGGGGATAGGGGGDTAADVMGSTPGGIGGIACTEPSTIPLRGGNGGGAGGTESPTIWGGAGGGGGGAIALVAMTSVTVRGVVAAPGAGGETIAMGSGGAGGGGGGAILVETPIATITGALTANGGGGGPASNPTTSAIRGERGHLLDVAAALGGTAAGNGGAATAAPTSGTTMTAGGGGGGAVGVIEIKVRDAMLAGATLSPTPTQTQPVIR